MNKKYDPFDLNMDGKVDLQDHMLYDLFYGDEDEKKTPRREVRWTNEDSDTLCRIIGGIVGFILFCWLAVTFL